MAKLTWTATRGFDLRDYDFSLLFDGTNTIATSQRYTVDYSDYYNGSYYSARDEFRGSGFVYDYYGVPAGGTIKSYARYEGGLRIGILDGVKISVTSMVKAASTFSTSDDYSLMKKALAGNDVITGGSWADRLEGFGGKDKLTGGLDGDKLYGGTGADTFIYKRTLDSFAYVDESGKLPSMDAIFDFSSRQKDKLDLRKIDANESRAGNNAFTFIGKAGFHDKAGELRYEKVRGGIHVEGDTDGDGYADLTVFLKGVAALSKGDFYL